MSPMPRRTAPGLKRYRSFLLTAILEPPQVRTAELARFQVRGSVVQLAALRTLEDDIGYFRIKVLELLLFLSITPFESGRDRRRYLSARQACVVEQIHDVLTQNLDQNITLEALSKRFDIGMTTMKNCFRAVYGKPINTWRREYRLHVGARMLRETDKSVLEIANSVGYENPSKFADAFRKQLGVPPLEYRKNNWRFGAFRMTGVET